MTAIVTLNCGTYALFVADRRRTRFEDDGSRCVYDDQLKLSKTPIGLLAATGSGGLTPAVADRLAQGPVAGMERVWTVAQDVRAEVLRDFADEPALRDMVRTTNLLFSYFGPAVPVEMVVPTGGNALDDPGVDRIRVVFSNLDARGNVARYGVPTGRVWVHGPDLDDRLTTYVRSCEQSMILPASDDAVEITRSISRNISVTAAVIRQISDGYPSVSPTFHVAVHIAPGRIEISGPSDGGAPLFDWL